VTPLPLRTSFEPHLADMTGAEEAIARSVLYAALFDYPLTLSQLRQTLIGSLQMPSAILDTVRGSAMLSNVIDQQDGYFFPVGRADLIETRLRREERSRAFLAAHLPLLRVIAALPYVRMVALSGSIAHLNLEPGGDLDLFIVTRGGRVWSTGVAVVLLAKLLRRRSTLCANYVVADSDLEFSEKDLFTANQVINLQPLTGYDVLREIVRRNPFVTQFYPNFHASGARVTGLHQSRLLRAARSIAESVLVVPSLLAEWVCRAAYRTYLRRRASTWQSPEQVVLGDRVLKLHTRSHRRRVLDRFDDSVHEAIGDR
jgi:hypothetical protein